MPFMLRFNQSSLRRRTSLVATVLCLFALSVAKYGHAQGCSDQAVQSRKFDFPGLAPLLLFTEYNPWAMAIGSDTPTFAAYEDGTIIYWKGDLRSGEYVSTHLGPAELQSFMKALPVFQQGNLKDCYSLTNWTDQPTNVLVIKTDSGYKSISVYGQIRRPLPREDKTDSLPSELQATFASLLAYTNPEAHRWKPDFFEVMIWPFTYSKEKPKPWPSSWPDLDDPATVKRSMSYSLFVPISQFDAFTTFAHTIGAKQAVLIDGKKWTISARLPFPHERVATSMTR